MIFIDYNKIEKVLALFDLEDLKYLDLGKIFNLDLNATSNSDEIKIGEKEKKYVKKRGVNNDKRGK